eukprot:GHVR01116394.1.p1 GENE.GHVR01116394.1~~GHVR01116394.1.p1  ORF type:complete len:209 (+),score=21.64 GHVR01116394.1:617-1243(+)
MEDLGHHFIENKRACNLFVFHLPGEWTDTELLLNFQTFGHICSAVIAREKETGRNKGFGFVCFEEPQAALDAILSMNGFAVGGKRLTVQLKQNSVRRNPNVSVASSHANAGAHEADRQWRTGHPARAGETGNVGRRKRGGKVAPVASKDNQEEQPASETRAPTTNDQKQEPSEKEQQEPAKVTSGTVDGTASTEHLEPMSNQEEEDVI